jgi:hypothetical protein
MGKTYRKEKYSRDRFDGEAAMEKAREDGLLGKGRDKSGEWVGKDTRGHNQICYDECVSKTDPWKCPCKKCDEKVKEFLL